MNINLGDQPLISIIVPIYDVEPYLQRCIDSICKQTYSNWEMILVDDGSPDGCGDICDAAAMKDSRILAFHKTNGGLATARNCGLDNAHGEFITCIDPDDTIEPSYLSYLLNLHKKFDADIVSCPVRHIGFPVVDHYSSSEPKAFGGEAAAEYILCGTHGFSSSACHALFRSDLFINTRFVGPHLIEDLDITYRLALQANSCVVGTIPHYNYFYRDNNSSSGAIEGRYKDWRNTIDAINSFTEKQYPQLNKAVRTRESSNSSWILKGLASNLNEHKEIVTEIRKTICANIPHILFYAECPLIIKLYSLSLILGKTSFCCMYKIVLWLKKVLRK